LIDFKISAMACARGFAPRLPSLRRERDGIGFRVAFSDHEHGVHFHLLAALDLDVKLAS
jgi:hypothetical protein